MSQPYMLGTWVRPLTCLDQAIQQSHVQGCNVNVTCSKCQPQLLDLQSWDRRYSQISTSVSTVRRVLFQNPGLLHQLCAETCESPLLHGYIEQANLCLAAMWTAICCNYLFVSYNLCNMLCEICKISDLFSSTLSNFCQFVGGHVDPCTFIIKPFLVSVMSVISNCFLAASSRMMTSASGSTDWVLQCFSMQLRRSTLFPKRRFP